MYSSLHDEKLESAGVKPGNMIRVGVNSGIEWELNSIPDSIPGIGLGIRIEKKELELNWN